MSKIIEIRNCAAAYGENEILHKVSLTVECGEFVVIIGSSGCGKTTLLKMMNGLVVPTEGEVLVNGERLTECNLVAMRRRIGYAVQGAKLFPHMTVEDNICYVPGLGKKMPKEEKKALARKMLDMVELPGTGRAFSKAIIRWSETAGGDCKGYGIESGYPAYGRAFWGSG